MVSPNLMCLALLLLLGGCAGEEYYRAVTARYAADRARYQRQAQTPLVDFSWTDADGVARRMVVNLPPGCSGAGRPLPRVPAPWEGWYRFYDRTLATGERFLPWLLWRGDESHTSQDTTYTLGDHSFVLQTPGDGSAIELHKDLSTVTTTEAP